MNAFPPLRLLVAALMCVGALAAQAQTLPAEAPAGSTVQCQDGSFASPDSRTGACRGHQGVRTWYGPSARPAEQLPAVQTQSAAVSQTGFAPTTGSPNRSPGVPDPATLAIAPGGGLGKVWADEAAHVYRCLGDRDYGRDGKGAYMTEADAQARGLHPVHDRHCG